MNLYMQSLYRIPNKQNPFELFEEQHLRNGLKMNDQIIQSNKIYTVTSTNTLTMTVAEELAAAAEELAAAAEEPEEPEEEPAEGKRTFSVDDIYNGVSCLFHGTASDPTAGDFIELKSHNEKGQQKYKFIFQNDRLVLKLIQLGVDQVRDGRIIEIANDSETESEPEHKKPKGGKRRTKRRRRTKRKT